ncbi:MAG: hypothetical protein LBE12_13670 [Planctomycetaceae bacterium]|nr:hypothetical protein [Planctomycetaceae bacterium]
MSQADYYRNGYKSACGTINSPLSTIHYPLSTSSPLPPKCETISKI